MMVECADMTRGTDDVWDLLELGSIGVAGLPIIMGHSNEGYLPRYCYTRWRWIPMPLSDTRVGYSWMGLLPTNWDIILGVGYYSRITHTHLCIFLDRVEMLFSF